MKSEDYKGDKCPNCEDGNINADRMVEVGINEAARNCDCTNCGAVWTEEFKLVGYNNLILREDDEEL